MFGVEAVDGLHFATKARTLADGLNGQLEEFLQCHPDTRLIIVDTLQKVREAGPLAAPGHEPGDFQDERLHGFPDDGLLRPRQFPDTSLLMERKGEFLVLLVPSDNLHGGGRVGALFLLQDKRPVNVNVSSLFNDFGIVYIGNQRTSDRKTFTLLRKQEPETGDGMTMNDD